MAVAASVQEFLRTGTHEDAVAMRFDDFAAITRPMIGRFAHRSATR